MESHSLQRKRLQHLASRRSATTVQRMEFRALSVSLAEYQIDMLREMRLSEMDPGISLRLIEQQPEVRLSMRPLLLDFLMEVVISFELSHLTFVLAINLIDRYCSIRIVKKQHYQLLGLSALWISSKIIDPKHKVPLLDALRGICAYTYEVELFKEMERHILKSIEWMVSKPIFIDYMNLLLNIVISNNSDQGTSMIIKKSMPQIIALSTYIGELFHFYPDIYFGCLLLLLAVIAILMAVLMLRVPINLMSLMSFFNTIPTGSCDNSTASMPPLLLISLYQNIFNTAFLDKVLKIFTKPPASMACKYFESRLVRSSVQAIPSWLVLAKDSLFNILYDKMSPTHPSTPPFDVAVTPSLGVSLPASGFRNGPRRAASPSLSISGLAYPLTPRSGRASPDGNFDMNKCSRLSVALKGGNSFDHSNHQYTPSASYSSTSHTQVLVSSFHLRKRPHSMVCESSDDGISNIS